MIDKNIEIIARSDGKIDALLGEGPFSEYMSKKYGEEALKLYLEEYNKWKRPEKPTFFKKIRNFFS